MKMAAIYARVSSDKQKEENTIASQTAALVAFAREHGYDVPGEWIFEDEGFSGASLVRPGLERLRDLAAEGQIEAVLVYAPDRLSRKYAPASARAWYRAASAVMPCIELRRVRVHARSTTTAASARTLGGTLMVQFATIDPFAKISWIKLFGPRLSITGGSSPH